MRSMTGYGRAAYSDDSLQIEVQIKSYNSRFLEIVKNIPSRLSSYEMLIDEMVKKALSRGHVEILVRLAVKKSESRIIFDEGLLESYKSAFDEIEKKTGAKAALNDYIGISGLLSVDSSESEGAYKKELVDTLSAALDSIVREKEREGEETKKDIVRLLSEFEDGKNEIEALSLKMEEYFRSLFLRRYEEIKGDVNLDEKRLEEEMAILLVKYSINEEIKRLCSHIKEFRSLIEKDEPVSKRMDFLCQEMNRETNTIASKSQMAEINLIVVRMKDSLENIREQIRNIE
ncbi:MAG TPA: YicC family protein [Candidatus Ornithospirochaeta avicola]|uniref:YicC family protein n=1 Tax=Candidatus Ornithospirochaeta avicola TaxID=2840896 RepID=A0A9D1TNT2_9SPIO|nr:YicC family protein [Candidatus Ornithospirochaeta avicola]